MSSHITVCRSQPRAFNAGISPGDKVDTLEEKLTQYIQIQSLCTHPHADGKQGDISGASQQNSAVAFV